MDSDFNKEEKLRERAFKSNQAIQIVQAVIGTAQGVIAALSEPIFPLMLARMVMAATSVQTLTSYHAI